MTKAVVQGNSLRYENQDGQILVSATPNPRGKWRWYSSVTMRSGRGWVYSSAQEALTAAAKLLGITVVQQ